MVSRFEDGRFVFRCFTADVLTEVELIERGLGGMEDQAWPHPRRCF